MTKGISLHVGVNFTNVSSTSLLGCVNDANEMAVIAEQHGFEEHEVIADTQATFDYVTNKIKLAATELAAGDVFFFTFSGHGGFVTDKDGDEGDYRDESLVLHDFMLCDDYLARELWPRFASGVRILMIADSCNSGTVAELADEDRSRTAKAISDTDRIGHLARNKRFYKQNCQGLPKKPIGASVLQIGACEDFDTTADGFPNSVFTQKLLDVVRGATPPTDYVKLVADVAALLVNTQVPQLTRVGVSNPAFEAQNPFTI